LASAGEKLHLKRPAIAMVGYDVHADSDVT